MVTLSSDAQNVYYPGIFILYIDLVIICLCSLPVYVNFNGYYNNKKRFIYLIKLLLIEKESVHCHTQCICCGAPPDWVWAYRNRGRNANPSRVPAEERQWLIVPAGATRVVEVVPAFILSPIHLKCSLKIPLLHLLTWPVSCWSDEKGMV